MIVLRIPNRIELVRICFCGLFLWYFLGESTSNVANAIDWAKRDKEFTDRILPIVKKFCLECHSGAEAEGGLALSHFTSTKAILKERRTWEKVIQRLELGDMPPPEAPKLAAVALRKPAADDPC